MSHTIQLPEEVYAAIAAYAARHGQTPEDAIQAWARALPEREAAEPETSATSDPIDDPAFDPWAGFRGITTALSADSVDRHDAYLAEEYTENHEPTK